MTTPFAVDRSPTGDPVGVRIIVDADACIPADIRAALRIAVAPAEPELLLERIPIPRLALERGPFAIEAIAEACGAVAEPGEAVVYIRTGDAHGSPDEAGAAARAAVEARGATFHLVETRAALMGAGWAAVAAAEAAANGADPQEAVRVALQTVERSRVMAMLEHPEVVGVVTPSLYFTPNRMVAMLDGPEVTPIIALPRRANALIALRDEFGAAVREEPGRARIAVHHGAAGAAADAMAAWCQRNLDAAEVFIAPITRHQGARLGPGFLALAWLRES